MQLHFHRAIKLIDDTAVAVNRWLIQHHRGHYETRLVQAHPDVLTCYVSSHTGTDPVTIDGYTQQVQHALEHHQTHAPWCRPAPKRLNVNFMGMGEPLANPHLLTSYTPLQVHLQRLAQRHQLDVTMNISTVMPRETDHVPLEHVFRGRPVTLFYNLYSVDEDFRRRWLPSAQPWHDALRRLEHFQRSMAWHPQSQIQLQWAFIEGENDQPEQVERIVHCLREASLEIAGFNLVRFQGEPNGSHRECSATRLQQCYDAVNRALGCPPESCIVPVTQNTQRPLPPS